MPETTYDPALVEKYRLAVIAGISWPMPSSPKIDADVVAEINRRTVLLLNSPMPAVPAPAAAKEA